MDATAPSRRGGTWSPVPLQVLDTQTPNNKTTMTLFDTPDAQSPTDCTVTRTRSRALTTRLVRAWHSTLPNSPAGFRLAFIAYAPNQAPVAVALWGRPVARSEDQTTTLQLTRLAHGPGAPRNLGSWFLGQMRRYIRRHMPEIQRLITYHDADRHDGALYRADNWRLVYHRPVTNQDWRNRPGRSSPGVTNRVKWERNP